MRFEVCDPDVAPARQLLAEMSDELNAVYETEHRLQVPAVNHADLRAPGGTYLVGWEDDVAVAGGGVRSLYGEVGEIKRMFVRPGARSRGVAGALLAALEDAARAMGYRAVRLDTGPRQQHAMALYRRSGYVEIAAYNENPFACYWAEKELAPPR